ncbi:hypothetical protein GEV33_010767 [Tenebrio molitor]|uniref:Uncharacterized protein n=1 Tax=Tenebrio molitor TaxID=7067 RepID=A0A8J6HC08_TENMO|nr:hypothetical protein GEV33_010767 [Tenebrio molitor]
MSRVVREYRTHACVDNTVSPTHKQLQLTEFNQTRRGQIWKLSVVVNSGEALRGGCRGSDGDGIFARGASACGKACLGVVMKSIWLLSAQIMSDGIPIVMKFRAPCRLSIELSSGASAEDNRRGKSNQLQLREIGNSIDGGVGEIGGMMTKFCKIAFATPNPKIYIETGSRCRANGALFKCNEVPDKSPDKTGIHKKIVLSWRSLRRVRSLSRRRQLARSWIVAGVLYLQDHPCPNRLFIADVFMLFIPENEFMELVRRMTKSGPHSEDEPSQLVLPSSGGLGLHHREGPRGQGRTP